jgi:hypothetical protein
MGNDSNTFTIALPEMRKYKMLDVSWRLLFLFFWILWGVISFGNVEAPREIRFAIMGVAVVLAGGFAFYASRKQKALRPLINRRFAEEFSAKTGHEYPQNFDILTVKQTIAVRKDDGSVLLWGVNRSTGSVIITPMAQARP